MRKFTYEQYKQMAEWFNQRSFREKIKLVKASSDILAIGSDHNCFGVIVKDKEIQAQLFENDCGFSIEMEWSYNEIYILLEILGIDNLDL